MLEFLIGCGGGNEETVSVTYIRSIVSSQSLDDSWYKMGDQDVPAVSRPMIRVPPILVCTIGTTSPSSLSKAE